MFGTSDINIKTYPKVSFLTNWSGTQQELRIDLRLSIKMNYIVVQWIPTSQTLFSSDWRQTYSENLPQSGGSLRRRCNSHWTGHHGLFGTYWNRLRFCPYRRYELLFPCLPHCLPGSVITYRECKAHCVMLLINCQFSLWLFNSESYSEQSKPLSSKYWLINDKSKTKHLTVYSVYDLILKSKVKTYMVYHQKVKYANVFLVIYS